LRHPSELRYRIDKIGEVPAVLEFVCREAGLDARAAYATFNMGAGFALFVAADAVERTVAVAASQGVRAWHAGRVEAGRKELVIEPLGITYAGDDLQLR